MSMITEIDQEALLSTLERNIDAADTYANSEVGEQRDKAHRYYYGEPMGNEIRGRSHHVSMDVFDAVEAVKAMMLETFSADRNICKFDPQSAEDVMPAKMATALTNYVFYRQNNGHKVLTDVIHDALVAKTGIVKRYWKEDYRYDSEEFEGLDEASFNMLIADPAVELMTLEEVAQEVQVMDQTTGMPMMASQVMYSGELRRRRDVSKVCVEAVEPEDFLISPRAKSIQDADFCSYRASRTRGELMSEGFDPALIERLDEEDMLKEDGSLGRDSVDSFRKDSTLLNDDKDREYVTVYESYIKKHDESINECVYYKVIHSRRVMLDVELVSEMPFRSFCPFPLPHRFYGMSLADVIVDLQKTMSSLKRGVVDHLFLTTTSRWVANLSLVKNPRDLLDNRVGAVIDVNSPNPEAVVRPLPTPQLNGNVYTAIESMEQEKEARSGASRMSRGMDSTVVSKQNSSDLITQFMNASNRRIMVMCRNFAESFLKPLMHDIYKLAVQYERQEKLVQLDGQFVPVDPATLGDRTEMSVAVALTPEEQMKEAQMLLSLDQQFTMNPNDPSLGGLYGQQQRHALLSRAFELMNIKGGAQYLADPASPEFQQMMAQQQEQAQMAQARQEEVEKFQAGITARQVAVMEGQLELEVVKEQNRMLLEMEKQEFTEETEESRLVLDTEKTRHDMMIRDEELELEKSQGRNVSIGG
jgi:hypothetical protein